MEAATELVIDLTARPLIMTTIPYRISNMGIDRKYVCERLQQVSKERYSFKEGNFCVSIEVPIHPRKIAALSVALLPEDNASTSIMVQLIDWDIGSPEIEEAGYAGYEAVSKTGSEIEFKGEKFIVFDKSLISKARFIFATAMMYGWDMNIFCISEEYILFLSHDGALYTLFESKSKCDEFVIEYGKFWTVKPQHSPAYLR